MLGLFRAVAAKLGLPFGRRARRSGDTQLCMVLLDRERPHEPERVLTAFGRLFPGSEIPLDESDDSIGMYTIDGYRAFAAFMPFPVPGDEVQSAAQRSWMWENAEAEVTKARAHVLVTAMGPGPDTKYRVEHDKSSFIRGQKVLRLHIP